MGLDTLGTVYKIIKKQNKTKKSQADKSVLKGVCRVGVGMTQHCLWLRVRSRSRAHTHTPLHTHPKRKGGKGGFPVETANDQSTIANHFNFTFPKPGDEDEKQNTCSSKIMSSSYLLLLNLNVCVISEVHKKDFGVCVCVPTHG